jgi:hypothetical protein
MTTAAASTTAAATTLKKDRAVPGISGAAYFLRHIHITTPHFANFSKGFSKHFQILPMESPNISKDSFGDFEGFQTFTLRKKS